MRVVTPGVLRLAALIAAASAAPAAAQTPGQTVVLAVAGVGGGLALMNVAIVVPPPVSFPVGVGLGVYGAARYLRMDASLRNTLGDAASGMLAGTAAGGVVYLLLRAGPLRSQDELSSALYGIGVAAAGTVAWAVADVRLGTGDVRLAPAALRTPEGARVAGLTVHVSL